MLAAVFLEILVHPVGDPQQRQLAQRGQIAGTEVVREGRVDLVGLVDVAVCHASAQRLRRHVDELDLVGAARDLVRNGFPLADACDRLDHITQRFEMLDVDGRDDVDAGLEQLLHVLPALGVPRARHVRVREFVHERHRGATRQDRVDVHLGEGAAPVLDLAPLDELKAVQHHLSPRPAVVLDEAHDAVGAPLDPAVRLGQHRVRLADAGCRTEVDAELAASHVQTLLLC